MVAHAFITSVLGRQKQVGLYEFEASVVYMVSSKLGKAAYIVRPCLKE